MIYTPISTHEAIAAVVKGTSLKGREIPDLRALIEGIQNRVSESENVSLQCNECRILECECAGINITFPVHFSMTMFTHDADFRKATFAKDASFYNATFKKKTDFADATFAKEADFSGSKFTALANFPDARFAKRASFSDAKFTNDAFFADATFAADAFFNNASFACEAVFMTVAFEANAHFGRTIFESGAWFTGACFAGKAFFHGVMFEEKANFNRVSFGKGAVLVGNLVGVDFKGASFNQCSLKGGELVADMDRANLEQTQGLILNSTPIRDARFSRLASDPWSQLRRAYTGPRLVFTLMFLVAFFTPYALRTFMWVGVNRVQEELKQNIEDVRDKIEALESMEHAAARPLAVALDAVEDRLPRDNDDRWQRKSVLELVLGMDKKWTYWATAIVLLAYNFCRAALTWLVAPMRDAEERTGVSPAYRRATSYPPVSGHGWQVASWPVRWVVWWIRTSADSYHWMIWPHKFTQLVLLVAVISFCLHAAYWLQLPVTIPAQPTAPPT